MCTVLGIIKKGGNSGFRIEKGSEVDGTEEAKVVQRGFGKVKGRRKEKIVLFLKLQIACWWFCKERSRKRKELRLL